MYAINRRCTCHVYTYMYIYIYVYIHKYISTVYSIHMYTLCIRICTRTQSPFPFIKTRHLLPQSSTSWPSWHILTCSRPPRNQCVESDVGQKILNGFGTCRWTRDGHSCMRGGEKGEWSRSRDILLVPIPEYSVAIFLWHANEICLEPLTNFKYMRDP